VEGAVVKIGELVGLGEGKTTDARTLKGSGPRIELASDASKGTEDPHLHKNVVVMKSFNN